MQRRPLWVAVPVIALIVVASAAVALAAPNRPASTAPAAVPAAAATTQPVEPTTEASSDAKGPYSQIKGGLGADGIKALHQQGGGDGAADAYCSVELPAGADPDTCPSWVKPSK